MVPVVVEYVAPPECASVEAFHALLTTQVGRTPRSNRAWRFSVSITRSDDAYVGRLTTEAGDRELRAQTCDEVAAALSLVIAMATPPDPPPPILEPAQTRFLPVATMPDRVAPRPHDASTSFRFALGVQDWTNASSLYAAGPTLSASIEPRWGWYHMMFELSAGAQVMPVSDYSIAWTMIDFESCPIDVAIGHSNISLIACNSLAFGIAGNPSNAPDPQPGAIFFGGDARVRWQSPWTFFAEAHAGALISTQSGPWDQSNGWWMNLGAQVGVTL